MCWYGDSMVCDLSVHETYCVDTVITWSVISLFVKHIVLIRWWHGLWLLCPWNVLCWYGDSIVCDFSVCETYCVETVIAWSVIALSMEPIVLLQWQSGVWFFCAVSVHGASRSRHSAQLHDAQCQPAITTTTCGSIPHGHPRRDAGDNHHHDYPETPAWPHGASISEWVCCRAVWLFPHCHRHHCMAARTCRGQVSHFGGSCMDAAAQKLQHYWNCVLMSVME